MYFQRVQSFPCSISLTPGTRRPSPREALRHSGFENGRAGITFTMQIHTSALPLTLTRPFRIAHGVSHTRTNVLVECGGGLGEAGLPPYLGIDFDDARSWLASVKLPAWTSDEPPPVRSWLGDLHAGPDAAICALDMALHDAWAQRIGQPLYRLFGLDPTRTRPTFQTVSIPETLEDLTLETLPSNAPLKLKLGSGNLEMDVQIARRVRDLTDAAICVDANGAWSIPDAVRAIPRLAELNVVFVEQPIAANDPEDWHLLRRLLANPSGPVLVADESVRSAEDVLALAGAADAINVKLAKCGGFERSLGLIALARSLDMGVVLGCMVESSLAITAACHLASVADYTDLDGADLLSDDPFVGVRFEGGVPILSDSPGLGVSRRGG
ncbi:MAG: L-alanine-DL-glutamate epimerase-like enolase superfamily enzyme [Thalassolituus oleivorans]